MAPTGGVSGGGNIKVVVRVRPFNTRELDRNAKCIVSMQDRQTILQPPPEAEERLRKSGKGLQDGQKVFKYDKSYWSFNKEDSNYAGQDNLFGDLGVPLLDNAFQGYNNCIFAYGQTGSGKTYSMMGYGEDAGVIPKICRSLFERIEGVKSDVNLTCTVEASYLEIYNERVRDLLNPANKGNLRVREHPATGPYVEDLAKLAVRSFPEIENLMDEGNKARTVAATNMNETSSRSHAVFTLTLTQKRHDVETNMDTEKVSRISLVDLAGSERQQATGATGARLKEGAEINRSLSTLGRVIASLADLSSGKKGMKVPYRDSVLTWLLKDSLGGNSLTAMIAAISPADINFEETLSTLRYADSAKRIKNHAVVNEDPNARMIRELKEELALLRSKLGSGGSAVSDAYPPGTPLDQQYVTITQADGTTKRVSKAEIMEQLSQSEKLYKDLNQTWEEKLLTTQRIHREREAALEELGISIEKGNIGLSTPKKMPHLVNLNDDPLLAECLVYNLKPGTTTVGNIDAEDSTSEIRLKGSKILTHHCTLENVDSVVTIAPTEGAAVMVNGLRVVKAQRLRSGNRLILGDFHIFRFNNPLEAKAERGEKSLLRHSVITSQLGTSSPLRPGHDRSMSKAGSEYEYDSSRAESPYPQGQDFDWSHARREAAGALLGPDQQIVGLSDDQLDNLLENVQRTREERRGRELLLEQDEDSDDMSSFLVRDKYMSNGTLDNFSLDTALTIPGTPTLGETGATDDDATLKPAQLDMQAQLDEQKQQYKEELRVAEASALELESKHQKEAMTEALETAKKDFEQQLRRQKANYEEQILRMTPQKSSGGQEASRADFKPLTSGEIAVARSVTEKWRQKNFILIAELMLQTAGLLKEGQIMSKIMNGDVGFQFVIVDQGQDRSSSYDMILQDFEAGDDALAEARKPCLGIRVADSQQSVIYIWSPDKLRSRVLKMRQMHQYTEQPEYAQHLRFENPFGEPEPFQYSLIGDGSVPLNAVFETRVQDFGIDVISPYTQTSIGKLRLSLEPSLAESPPSFVKFNIVLRDLAGFAEHEGTSVHVQMYVAGSSEENVATTQPAQGFGEGPIRFESIHSLSVSRSDAKTALMRVAVFARATPMHLDKLSSWDEIRELVENPKQEEEEAHRLRESEYQVEERHDVFAKIQILELAETGQYLPVEVIQSQGLDDGVHQLRQGLQRRVSICLTYSMTDTLPWDDIKLLRIGGLHLVDSSGRLTDLALETPEIALKLIHEPMVEDDTDGTSKITIIGQWDSSLHDSLLLDRTTAEQHKIRFTVKWDIESSRLDPASFMTFGLDQHLQITPRNFVRSQPILKSFWSQPHTTRSCSGVFSIAVRPVSVKHGANDLWRLDTAKGYVNGQELLGGWTPRGVSLVKDYITASRKRRQLQDIEAVKGSLGLRKLSLRGAVSRVRSRSTSPAVPSNTSINKELLEKYVALWQKPISTLRHPLFSSLVNNASPNGQNGPATDSNTSPPKPTRYIATVSHVPKNPISLKSGHLLMPTSSASAQTSSPNPQVQWKQRYVDLRPPYLYVHSVPAGDSLNAINLTHARVDHDPDFVRLLGGVSDETSAQSPGRSKDKQQERASSRAAMGLSHVLAVYGEHNTFLFAARNERSKMEWIMAIDRSYFVVDEDGGGDDEGGAKGGVGVGGHMPGGFE